jgi:hypothetical protein
MSPVAIAEDQKQKPGGSLRRAFERAAGVAYAAAFFAASSGTSEIVFSTWLAIW